MTNFFFPSSDRCDMPLGLEDGRIANPLMRASSFHSSTYAPWRARLNQVYGWTAKRNNRNQWFQVDFLALAKISRVAIQGRSNSHYWVKTYSVSYSKKGQRWLPYREQRRTKVFVGIRYNADINKTVVLTCLAKSLFSSSRMAIVLLTFTCSKH